MAECQNFFEETSSSRCRSSSSTERFSPAATASVTNDDCDDHGLELRLGPSGNGQKPKQHEMVRPIPLYPSLDNQRSGDLAHATENSPLFRGHSAVNMADKALFSKDSAFTTPPRISREQVWQTLQKTDSVLGQDMHVSKVLCDDSASSIWGRRSASMQIIMPSSEMSVEVGMSHIRRSCSNGIPQELLSRQSSFGQESLVDESPDATSLLSNGQRYEALELQKKKEMQAHRRLEARKRRRLLIEGKQQRKVRHNSGINNKQCISRTEIVHERSMVRNCTLDPHHKPNCEVLAAAKLGDDEGSKSRSQRKDAHTEEIANASRRRMFDIPCDEEDVNSRGNHTEKRMLKECESTITGCKNIKGDLTRLQNMIASCDLSVHTIPRSSHMPAYAGKDVNVIEGAKCPPSSCSETESIEAKHNNTCKELDFSERESSSQKSLSEKHLRHGSLANATPAELTLHGHTLPGVVSEQDNLSLPCSTQHPTSANGKCDGLQLSFASRASEFSSTGDWNSFAIKKSVGVFSEGKWRIPDEKSAFPPIRRTTSTNINHAVTEPLCSAKQLETHISLSASQLKFARMVFDSTADVSFKNRTNDMCGKFSCANRLETFKTNVKNQDDSYTEDEKPIVGLEGPGMKQYTQANMTAQASICRVKVKQEEDTTEERSFESHFVSTNQEPNMRGIQCGVIKRQSFSALPWVTTTGRGPNGKTINGVMYISSGRCVRLVCRCHGKHMSPAEFVEHSGSTDLSNPLRNIVVNPFPQLATTPV